MRERTVRQQALRRGPYGHVAPERRRLQRQLCRPRAAGSCTCPTLKVMNCCAIAAFRAARRVRRRVGPLRFTDDEHTSLREAAAEHGYKGESGFAADIVLAFLDGRFTANLPLSEDRRRTHMFRAQVLRALNRVGVKVNQVARALNSDYTPPDIRQRLDELHHLLTLVAEALRQPTDAREI
ncbi:plasmid mobilization relaxosome protein MobC [Streptomyces sp. NPDC048496]|uniref:plasmid mobilization relaxosome protein MobC n=1 Tax=Streptomyces sp. NPDC048496 TaxID=3365558 RepID=UPI00371599E3